MENLYELLAPFYDRLNGDLDYDAWADFLEESFRRYFPGRVSSVLDLACGTGSMTLPLARRGYDMVAVDRSSEMLSVARDRAEREGLADRILFLCQEMSELELYGTVEAIVCCLDSINHVTDRAALSRALHWVHNYLVPGGLFLFDLNTPYKFSEIYGDRAYILEEEGVLCAWQNRYRRKSRLCDFYVSLFTQGEDGRYLRHDAEQQERMYSLRAIGRLLRENGLELLSVCGDLAFSPPAPDCQRYYIAARAVKEEI